MEKILTLLSRDTLKSICFAVGISAEGREKQVLVDRILAAERDPDNEDDEGEAEQPEPKVKKVRGEEAAKPEPPAPPKPGSVGVAAHGGRVPRRRRTPFETIRHTSRSASNSRRG